MMETSQVEEGDLDTVTELSGSACNSFGRKCTILSIGIDCAPLIVCITSVGTPKCACEANMVSRDMMSHDVT